MNKLHLIFIFTFVLLFGLNSCDKEDTPQNQSDYLIFGRYYGLCAGSECVELYKISDGKLYEDDADNYPGGGPYNFVELSNAQYNLVSSIYDEIVDTLKNQPSVVFGCPDCYDQGGVYVELKENGETKSWNLDQDENNLPDFAITIVEEVNEKVDLLQ